MKFKKLVYCAIVTAMVVGAIAGCGSTANIDDTEVGEATESIETEVVTETEEESEEPTEEVEAETEANAEFGTESSATADTSKAETTAAHTHSWDGGTITQAATCTSNGVKTYTCSCGETKTETINAAGHNWVAQTTTVHHDAEGVNQQVKTGEQKVIICGCGETFYDTDSFHSHKANMNHYHYTVTTEPTYETQWFETSPAYDETVTTGYICSVCGTAK